MSQNVEAMRLSRQLSELKAENARLENLAKQNNNLAKMYRKQADEFRRKYQALTKDPA